MHHILHKFVLTDRNYENVNKKSILEKLSFLSDRLMGLQNLQSA